MEHNLVAFASFDLAGLLYTLGGEGFEGGAGVGLFVSFDGASVYDSLGRSVILGGPERRPL